MLAKIKEDYMEIGYLSPSDIYSVYNSYSSNVALLATLVGVMPGWTVVMLVGTFCCGSVVKMPLTSR